MGSLVEILAAELAEWPVGQTAFWCDPDNEIRGVTGYGYDFHPKGRVDEQDRGKFFGDESVCTVTKQEWEAARIISQPQAEEVAYRGPFPCAPIGEPENAIEFDIEFPSGVFKLEAQVDQIDGPIKWRDTIIHCQAIIEDCEREIAKNENLLALEGFALIPAMTPVMGVSDDMHFWESWQVGDIIRVTNDNDIEDGQYAILEIEDAGYKGDLPVKTYKGWPDTEYATLEFISRP